ncbi:C-type lectin domain-containing protein [Caenorhabditis elegans]|uniref:C-type lectin domain-containing protein n=1 Tax=Caenorhabditis elegans TaxID=6239 RepID=O44914_CAEEL|nr:C-type lectin domain-containing protein [Caenorhabditis elegans]CCD73675.1 C-type lectin domain-containing protein [Caenorhabditis elegans]|eukprot:NP_494582.1 C-type LECtin [Caenorhabditis elegans]
MLGKTALLISVCLALSAADCPAAWKAILNSQAEESEDNGCEAGWKFFNRPSGGWCMRVFEGFNAAKTDAEKSCKSVGSTLSGIQNRNEALYIQTALLAQIARSSGSVWVGMQRTQKCLKQPKSDTCSALTAFEYTDGSVTGTDGFIFQGNQPDNKELNQDCAVLLASKAASVSTNGQFYAATLDDIMCDEQVDDNGPRVMRGYICGKKAAK